MPAVPPLLNITANASFLDPATHAELSSNSGTTTSQLKAQWTSPSDILSLLLLLGPDVIQQALAQVVGRRVTPVAFSFGWVAYAMNALLSAVGG